MQNNASLGFKWRKNQNPISYRYKIRAIEMIFLALEFRNVSTFFIVII